MTAGLSGVNLQHAPQPPPQALQSQAEDVGSGGSGGAAASIAVIHEASGITLYEGRVSVSLAIAENIEHILGVCAPNQTLPSGYKTVIYDHRVEFRSIL